MSIAILSILGVGLAAGTAFVAREVGRRDPSPAAMAALATAGLATAAALPFLWVRLYGR